MPDQDIALLPHLMRRAGFGATPDELERYAGMGYEATVEELLHPEDMPPALEDEDLIRRYHVDENGLLIVDSCQAYLVYRMINTRRPLEEKLALFWHSIFATGYTKLNQPKAILNQIEMFRRIGLGRFRDLLVEVSRDPAMIFWLDNKDNHKDAVNENYGREILELFSMGVGNYTEDDVRQPLPGHSPAGPSATPSITPCALHRTRCGPMAASTGSSNTGTTTTTTARRPSWDIGERSTARTSSTSSVKQPATARFISRHLYNFFVADEPQVPAWDTVPPRDPDAIDTLVHTYFESGGEIRAMLRTLFNSDFFKRAQFLKVKSPAEMVAGAARQSGGFAFPDVEDIQLALQTGNMGQMLVDPPSVEGWHTGPEWVTTASLVNRVNFAVQQFADAEKPGVRSIIERVRAGGPDLTPNQVVDSCLELMGAMSVSPPTRQELVEHAADANGDAQSEYLVKELLQMIVATREYQMA